MERSGKSKSKFIMWFLLRLYMVIFDILAVNAAYFGALLVRFYVAGEVNRFGLVYFPAFWKFAPYYTVCCLLVFVFFKLYNNIWKYAGLNDLNRILAACVLTCVIQVVGTLLFVMRMPITYYAIGAVIQFVLIAASRFSYRFYIVERDRRRKKYMKTAINIMIVGVGETGRGVLKHFERNVDSAIKPVCMVDSRGIAISDMLDGIPIVDGVDKLADAVVKYAVKTVVLADNIMPQSVRKHIRDICQETGVELWDFSVWLQDFHGAAFLCNLMEYIRGPVEFVIDGAEHSFADGEQAIMSLPGKYAVGAVYAKDSKLVVELQTGDFILNDVKEEWVQRYKQKTGEEISFF